MGIFGKTMGAIKRVSGMLALSAAAMSSGCYYALDVNNYERSAPGDRASSLGLRDVSLGADSVIEVTPSGPTQLPERKEYSFGIGQIGEYSCSTWGDGSCTSNRFSSCGF